MLSKNCYNNLTKDEHLYLFNSAYYKECPYECKTCYQTEEELINCITCKNGYILLSCGLCIDVNSCVNGLFIDGRNCVSCLEKFQGCGKSCTTESCSECLEIYKTSTPGVCNTNNKLNVDFIYKGLGKYKTTNNKIQFRLYLKIIQGSIYSSRIKTILKITNKRKIFKEDDTIILGDCYQINVAEGSAADDLSEINSLAIFQCNAEFYRDITEKDKIIMTSAELIYFNGEKYKKLLYKNDIGVVVSDAINDYIEDEARRLGLNYTFEQIIGKEKCKCNNTGTILTLKGNVYGKSPINKQNYQLTISENKATCQLIKKVINSNISTLSCIISNKNLVQYNISNQKYTLNYSSTIYLKMRNTSGFCFFDDDESYDVIYGASSTNGISKGGIAAIVIISAIVILLIITIIGRNLIFDKSFNTRHSSENSQASLDKINITESRVK